MHITGGAQVCIFTFMLSEFDVTASTDCSSDYVTVTTGDLAQVLKASPLTRSDFCRTSIWEVSLNHPNKNPMRFWETLKKSLQPVQRALKVPMTLGKIPKKLTDLPRLWDLFYWSVFWENQFFTLNYYREALLPDTAASLPRLTLSPWVRCWRLSSTPTRCFSSHLVRTFTQ